VNNGSVCTLRESFDVAFSAELALFTGVGGSARQEYFVRAQRASSVFCDALSCAVVSPRRRAQHWLGTAPFTAYDVAHCVTTGEEFGKRRTHITALRLDLRELLSGDASLVDHLSCYAATLGHLTCFMLLLTQRL
jgi:hypothetical protein